MLRAHCRLYIRTSSGRHFISDPVSTTPTESQIERQMRLDYEAAEKAYRANMAEQDRLVQAGGANESDSCTQSDATGEYLRSLLQSLREVHKIGMALQEELPRSSASFEMAAGRSDAWG